MFGASELLTRALFTSQDDDQCRIHGELLPKANCEARSKVAEGPWVTYHFNECGYRTYASCGPKQPGTVRGVLLGSSVAEGLNVPYEQTFSELTARRLERTFGRKVEIENLGYENLSPLHLYSRLDEVLALKPDFVIYPVSPFDIDQELDSEQLAHRNDRKATFSKPQSHFAVAHVKVLQKMLNNSRAVLVAQHYLYANSNTYLRLYMAYGDRADYLREPLNARWQSRYSDFSLIVADMQARLTKAGVPLIIIAVPSRPEAALIDANPRPPHTDPFGFALKINQIATQAGAGFVDGVAECKSVQNNAGLFYNVDAHLTAGGNEVLARALFRKCTDGTIPAFDTRSTVPQTR